MVKDATLSAASVTSATTTTPLLRDKKDGEPYWPLIGTKDDIPQWLQDNDFIVGGHPMPTHSYARSLRLWRCLHMETMNIWIHLIGSAAFVIAGFTLHQWTVLHDLHLTTGDKFSYGVSMTAGALCFSLSTAFHTLRSHSYHVHQRWGRLDIFGICLLALGSGSSATYYATYCDPNAQQVYWGLNAAAALAAGTALFDTGGGGNKMRVLRGGVFCALAVTALLPIFHGVMRLGWERACHEIGAQWYAAEGLILLVGVSLFVLRLPERLSPGTFDILGHSHQLHHICAVLGQACHVMALTRGYRFRSKYGKC
jgi:adiponectin receptor